MEYKSSGVVYEHLIRNCSELLTPQLRQDGILLRLASLKDILLNHPSKNMLLPLSLIEMLLVTQVTIFPVLDFKTSIKGREDSIQIILSSLKCLQSYDTPIMFRRQLVLENVLRCAFEVLPQPRINSNSPTVAIENQGGAKIISGLTSHEELIKNALNVISVVCELRTTALNQVSVAFFAYGVSVLLYMVPHSSKLHATLRLFALEVLQIWIQELGKDSTEKRRQIFPGVFSLLFKVLLSGAALSTSKILEGSVELMTSILQSTLADSEKTLRLHREQDLLATLQPPKENNTDEWQRNAAENISNALGTILEKIVEHKSYKVRLAMCNLCRVVILKCPHMLSNSLQYCLQALLSVSNDEIESVSIVAKKALSEAQNELPTMQWLELQDVMRSQMRDLLEDLGKSKVLTNPLILQSKIYTLNGYVKAFEQDVQLLFETSFDVMLHSFILLFTVDAVDKLAVIHSHTSKTDDSVAYHKIRYKYLTDDGLSFSAAQQLVFDIGKLSCPLFLLNQLKSYVMECDNVGAGDTNAEALFVSKLLVSGVLHQSDPEKNNDTVISSSMHLLMEGYFELSTWQTVKDVDNNCSTIVVILESIGSFAALIGPAFKSYFILVLYPICEKLGNADIRIEQSAFSTLKQIALSTGYGSVENLLGENVDYLIDTLTMRLQRLEVFPWAPNVLNGILKHIGLTSVSLLDDALQAVVSSISIYSSDNIHMRNLLNVMATILDAIYTDLLSSSTSHTAVNDIGPERKCFFRKSALQSLIGEIESLIQEEPEAEDDFEPESGDTGDNNSTETPYVAVVSKLLNTCAHFCSVPNTLIKAQVLRMFKKGFQVLSIVPGNALLVAVNKYWAFLLRRMRDTEKPVVIAVLNVVTEITLLCGDFVGQRFSTDLWPLLLEQFQILKRYEVNQDSLQMKHLSLRNSSSYNNIDWTTSGSLEGHLKQSMLECVLACCKNCFIDRSCVTQMGNSVFQFLKVPKYNLLCTSIIQELINHDAGEMMYLILQQLPPKTRRDFLNAGEVKTMIGATDTPSSSSDPYLLVSLLESVIM